MEKRMVTINGVEFTTTAEEQITARLLKELWGASEDDRVFAQLANGEPRRLADEAVLPPEVNQVVIVPAFGKGWE
jgi:hypothetical protein